MTKLPQEGNLYAEKYFKHKQILQQNRMLLSENGDQQGTNLSAYLSTDTTKSTVHIYGLILFCKG